MSEDDADETLKCGRVMGKTLANPDNERTGQRFKSSGLPARCREMLPNLVLSTSVPSDPARSSRLSGS
jgi:hypothetical protein